MGAIILQFQNDYKYITKLLQNGKWVKDFAFYQDYYIQRDKVKYTFGKLLLKLGLQCFPSILIVYNK
jgi:hypothetical protein